VLPKLTTKGNFLDDCPSKLISSTAIFYYNNELCHSKYSIVNSGIGSIINLILLPIQQREKEQDTSEVGIRTKY
jgi:hypothetical protein